MKVNDVPITAPFRIKDIDTGHYIYTITDRAEHVDIPADIAALHVVGVMVDRKNGFMEIETEV